MNYRYIEKRSLILYRFLIENNRQILRFVVAGLFATGINFLVYRSIFLIFNNIIFASLLGYSSGLLCSFVFAKVWVFRKKSRFKLVKSLSIYILIYILGGIEMSLMIIFLNELINDYKIAWFAGAFVGSLNNYLGSKYLLFKK